MNAEKVFEQVWREFIRRLEALRNQKPKMTYEQLGEMCGVSKVTTKRWLEGAGGEKTSFPDMLRMRYMAHGERQNRIWSYRDIRWE